MSEHSPDPLDLRALDADSAVPLDADALFADIAGDIAAESGPVAWLRSLPTPRRLALGAVLTLGVVGVAFGFFGRVDWALYPLDRMVSELAGMVIVFAVAAWMTLLPAYRVAPAAGRVWALGLVGLGLPFVLAALPMAHGAHAASLEGAGADLVPRALECFASGVGAALPVLLLLVALDRGGQTQRTRVVFAGLAAGMAGVMALQVHCPITQPVHLLSGHASVVVGLLAGWGLFGALFRPQS